MKSNKSCYASVGLIDLAFPFLKIPKRRSTSPVKNRSGNMTIISATAANPSPSYLPYRIETTPENKGAINNIIVIPQIIYFFLFDLPRLIIIAIPSTNTNPKATNPIPNLDPTPSFKF